MKDATIRLTQRGKKAIEIPLESIYPAPIGSDDFIALLKQAKKMPIKAIAALKDSRAVVKLEAMVPLAGRPRKPIVWTCKASVVKLAFKITRNTQVATTVRFRPVLEYGEGLP